MKTILFVSAFLFAAASHADSTTDLAAQVECYKVALGAEMTLSAASEDYSDTTIQNLIDSISSGDACKNSAPTGSDVADSLNNSARVMKSNNQSMESTNHELETSTQRLTITSQLMECLRKANTYTSTPR